VSLQIGDRVRYVRRPEISEEMWAVGANGIWQRRAERDSLVVEMPHDDAYPTQYRLVTIWGPGEEAPTWADRDFWYAPEERLSRVWPVVEYEYGVQNKRGFASSLWFDTEQEARTYHRRVLEGGWTLVRRTKAGYPVEVK
jgi:hypothetical protein